MADQDVIALLEQDHREVERMFDELEALKGDHSDAAKTKRKELTEQVTLELVRHSVAEEVLVYPRVSKEISEDEAKHAREEHAEAEETLAQLEKLDPGDAEFDEELGKLMSEVRHHIHDEESEMFAHMRQTFSADELQKMGSRVAAFKKVAPTRPHPNVPNEALPRTAAGPLASLMDHMRDLASGRSSS